MKLSQENIKALHDCAENKQRLVVSGKNALGQKFTTEGIILPGITHDGQPKWVSECGFGLFVGQTKKNSLGETVKLFVPLYSYAKNDEYDCDTLYIQNVVSKADGTIVYTNPDFDAIITTSLAVQEAKPHTAKWFNIPLIVADLIPASSPSDLSTSSVFQPRVSAQRIYILRSILAQS